MPPILPQDRLGADLCRVGIGAFDVIIRDATILATPERSRFLLASAGVRSSGFSIIVFPLRKGSQSL